MRPPQPAGAIFGAPLWGDLLMRFVFVDAAGRSENEPQTVVVGLIVNADEQLLLAEAAIDEVLGGVPTHLKKGFIFSAKDVFNEDKFKDRWGLTDRLAILHRMMALPRKLKIPIAFGRVRRSWTRSDAPDDNDLVKRARWHHVLAFINCIAKADKYIREHADFREIGSVVAEDLLEMRQFLKNIPRMLRDNPSTAPQEFMRPTIADIESGYISQEGEMRVTRIRRSIHFVEKGDDTVLYLADACAFGLRRYFAEQKFGDEFASSILAQDPVRQDHAGNMSACLYFF